MKKDKQKAQAKANRKKAEKAVKAVLITELTTLVSTFAAPNKKLKKLIEKTASAFSKEIDKTAKPIVEVSVSVEEAPVKGEEVAVTIATKKPTKATTAKKTEKVTTK